MTILLADSANSVKQALMEHSVTKLAVFFGKQKANDVILSHMITFLNDKEDSQVRLILSNFKEYYSGILHRLTLKEFKKFFLQRIISINDVSSEWKEVGCNRWNFGIL